MDDIDMALIESLQKDARTKSDVLAKIHNISAVTARRRIRNLLKENIIRIVAITDPKKIGLSTVVGIHMELNPKTVDREAAELAKYKSVKSVSLSTGRFNLMALAIFRTTDDFQDFMRNVVANLDGLIAVETHIFLEFVKGNFVHG